MKPAKTQHVRTGAHKNIAIIGLGTLGTQLAIQAAAYGHTVRGFDPDPSAFTRMQTKVRAAMRMTRKGPTFPVDEWEQHAAKVEVHRDLAAALRQADLVIEVVPEDIALKRAVFAELDRLAPRYVFSLPHEGKPKSGTRRRGVRAGPSA